MGSKQLEAWAEVNPCIWLTLSVCMPDVNIYIYTPKERAVCISEGLWVKLATCSNLTLQVNEMKVQSTRYVLKDTCTLVITQR